jgi:hypothetical protein
MEKISQIEAFCSEPSLKKYLNLALTQKNIILMGDLNLHLPIETNILLQNDYSDLWLETEPIRETFQKKQHPLGFTWDPVKNTFIKYWLPFDNRRMRLDRIAVADKTTLFDVKSPVGIFGDRHIPSSRAKVYFLFFPLRLLLFE